MMCKFWSCLIDRDLKVHFDGNENSHENAIRKANLKDDKLKDRDFVRIEIVPKGLSMQRKDWKFKVDENGTLPEWFRKSRAKSAKLCFQTLWDYLRICNIPEVIDFIRSLKKIKWFSMCERPKKSWKMFYGKTCGAARDAAKDAAEDATEDATEDAAWDAAWDAAKDAAKDAARDAARDVAEKAAWDAAKDAAKDAAEDATRDAAEDAALYARYLVVKDKLAGKYAKHIKERMEVWKRGYGLYCDVKGKLYIYAKW